jgi:hypothetical protein
MKLPYSYIGEPLYHVLSLGTLKLLFKAFEAGVSCDDASGEISGRPLFGKTSLFKCPPLKVQEQTRTLSIKSIIDYLRIFICVFRVVPGENAEKSKKSALKLSILAVTFVPVHVK